MGHHGEKIGQDITLKGLNGSSIVNTAQSANVTFIDINNAVHVGQA